MIGATLPKVYAWRVAIRPSTLLLALVPVGLGSAIAAHRGMFELGIALAALAGALFLQVSANLANDVFDFRKGADGEARVGPTRAVAAGLLTQAEVFTGLALALTVSAALGVFLAWHSGWPLLVIGLTGLVCAVAYTAGPFPLGYHGLGDLFVFLFFGLAAVLGTAYAQTGGWERAAWPLAVAAGSLAVAVLNVNNMRDRLTDAEVGKRTLAVRFGRTGSRVYHTLLLGLPYVCVGIGVMTGLLEPLTLIVVGSVPLAFLLGRQVWRLDGGALAPLLGRTVALQMLFGVLVLPGVL